MKRILEQHSRQSIRETLRPQHALEFLEESELFEGLHAHGRH